MAIYSALGCPVQIVDAEKRRRWWLHFGSYTKVYDKKPPTEKQRAKAKESAEFDIWWIKAKQIGAYPDGSGANHIGEVWNWRDENEFRATDGIREIHAVCEAAEERRTGAKLKALSAFCGI